jgi:hypothetical protein
MLYCSSSSGEHFDRRARELRQSPSIVEGIITSRQPPFVTGRGNHNITLMKTTLFTFIRIAALAVIIGLFAGCAATRPIGDTVLGAGGAYLGHELSDGNPIATAAGAAGGVLLSEGMHYLAKKETQKAYAAGYDKGKSDAVKQQYWLYVSLQRQRNRSAASACIRCNCRNSALTV